MDFSVILLKRYKGEFLAKCICSILQIEPSSIVKGFENCKDHVLVYNVYQHVAESEFKTQLDIWLEDDLIENALDFCYKLNGILKDTIILPYTEEHYIMLDKKLQKYLAREIEGKPEIDFNDQFWIDFDNLIPIKD